MSYPVSSDFLAEIEKVSPTIIRRFYIGTSDYSNFVRKWPRFSRAWNEIKPVELNIELANHDNTFDYFKNDKTSIVNSCRVEFGVQYAVGSEETIDLYRGRTSKVEYRGRGMATCMLKLRDKLKPFSEIVVGTDESPADFTSSNYLAHDLAWYIVTSYGGFSAVQSTSNPDIDWESYQSWSEIFSVDNVIVNAFFDGQKITNILRRIGRMTDSSIVVENDKLRFARYTVFSEGGLNLGDGVLISANLSISDAEIVNNQIWKAGYDTSSDYHSISVFDVNSESIATYGQRDEIEEDTKIWYTNSASTINAAQRIIATKASPFERYDLETTLKPISQQIGDTVYFNDRYTGASGDAYRVLSYDIDMEKCTMSIVCDQSQISNYFTLDIDSSSAQIALGWLDQAYNPLV